MFYVTSTVQVRPREHYSNGIVIIVEGRQIISYTSWSASVFKNEIVFDVIVGCKGDGTGTIF